MAFLFGATSIVTLPANLIAAPAVAPVMWLGMAVAGLGQLGRLPLEPLTAAAGALAGFVAQVAEWFAAPGWASAEVELSGVPALAVVYASLAAATTLLVRWLSRSRRIGSAVRRPRAVVVAALALALVVGAAFTLGARGRRAAAGSARDLPRRRPG